MSNHLAIATITATLQQALQSAIQVDVDGARATTLNPSEIGSGESETGVNVFLYHVVTNPALQNIDLAPLRSRNNSAKRQKALDLYYIFSFYGNNSELIPQRLLGSVVKTLNDTRIITKEMIRATCESSTLNFLQNSDLAEQVQQLSIMPLDLSLDDLSKTWGVFFQTPYLLSLAYKVLVVLIEGDKTFPRSLPIRDRQLGDLAAPMFGRPVIERITSQAGEFQPIVATSTLLIQGKHLQGDLTQVRIGNVDITPPEVSETNIVLPLSLVPPTALQAGVQTIRLIHSSQIASLIERTPSSRKGVESNAIPFVLCPNLKTVELESFEGIEDEPRSGQLKLRSDVPIGSRQRVVVALNEWSTQNPASYFMGAIAQLQESIKNALLQNSEDRDLSYSMREWLTPLQPVPLDPQPRLVQLCQLFSLTPLERNILMLCAGVEVSSHFAALCAEIHHNPQQPHVTLNVVLRLFQTNHWEAFHPDAPLRRWRLIEIGGGSTLANSPIRLDERILHDLLGGHHLDQRLQGILSQPVAQIHDIHLLPPSHRYLVEQVIKTALAPTENRYIVQLCGLDPVSKMAIAIAACGQQNLGILMVAVDALPTDLAAFNQVRCLCEREALLTNSVLVLDRDRLQITTGEGAAPTSLIDGLLNRWLETTPCPVILLTEERRTAGRKSLITLEVDNLSIQEQRNIWQQIMAAHLEQTANSQGQGKQESAATDETASLQGEIDTLVTYFNLSAPAIRSAWVRALASMESAATNGNGQIDQGNNLDALPKALWNACLTQSRPKLDDLAQFIEAQANWSDLVLPEKEKNLLQTIAAHVRQRTTVYEQWGFAKKSHRGLGISTLFAGASGTGKTMAAEVLAKELNLNLYKIDLSSVVSKFIGETEKNLRRIFDAAETGGAILLFDEADSLFGKRSEVKDSHDRYANMEVSYLLQRIESYRGLAILTTNLKTSMDRAFLRRLRFVIQFPFPEASQRAEIWRRIFPAETPTKGLAYEKLGMLQVAGGNIRNVALNAAFLAADDNEPVQMKHILMAAQNEYIKLERSLTEGETKGWVRKEAKPAMPRTS